MGESRIWLKTIARRVLPSVIQAPLREYYLTRQVLAAKEQVEPEMAVLQVARSDSRLALTGRLR